MLRTETLVASRPMAEELASRNLSLTSATNSLLNQLINAATPPTDLVVSDQHKYAKTQADESIDQITSYFQDVEDTTTSTDLEAGKSIFDRTSDGLINDLSKFVNTHISYARNTVLPIMRELEEGIEDFSTRYSESIHDTQYQVRSHCVPEPLLEVSISEDIKSMNTLEDRTYDLLEPLTQMQESEVRELILTGSAKLDKVINEWASRLQGEWFSNLYNTFFCNSVSIDNKLAYGRLPMHNDVESLNHLLAIYLLATKRYSDIPEGVSLSAKDYKFQIKNLRDWSATHILRLIESTKGYATRGRVILGHNKQDKVVDVFDESYKKFLEMGGSVEAILGAAVSSSRAMNASDLMGIKDEMERSWMTYQAVFGEKASSEYVGNLKSYLRNKFASLYKDTDEVEQEYLESNSSVKEAIFANAATYIDGLRMCDTSDTGRIVLTLIAGIRFSHTSAYQILDSMEQAARINPEIDPREAALVALIDYLTLYMASQITVVR